MIIKLGKLKLNDVLGAVWLATAILTYDKFLRQGGNLSVGEMAFSQKEIRQLAKTICTKAVNPARISQWGNADHANHRTNYLKNVAGLRRLTIPGEHGGNKEMPVRLLDGNQVLFIDPYTALPFRYIELVRWLKLNLKSVLKASHFDLNHLS